MATTNNTMTRSQFNFDAYNAVMKDANAGLKLFLVTQLLGDVCSSAVRYRSPLVKELMDLADEANSVRESWKDIASKSDRQNPVGQPSAPKGETPVADSNQYAAAIY